MASPRGEARQAQRSPVMLSNLPDKSAKDLPSWDNRTYPDETGFRRRTAPLIPLFAAQPFGIKCRAVSRCPDTGLTVRVYALEGEEIVSPYTGRRYKQGDTGYFGPKARGADGRITAFGGDPLKQDLPPALARLLLQPDDAEARAFLSIPGSLNQQYHFAAANWARFYALLADKMGETWKREFAQAVADYSESRRPSDGSARENLPLSHPHDLVGEPGELLGGRVSDGGTENHKTMWRTAGLLYAQMLGPQSVISSVPALLAEQRITAMLTGFLQTILTVGNGEYDSSTYYPYSLRAYLNLYDLSPKSETRALGKAMLDYYIAAYGLKVIGGVHAGAVKRGWAGDGDTLSEMDAHLWMWANRGVTVPVDGASMVTSIHQATTSYRPNRVLVNLLTKNVPLPFEARMSRPTYHSKERNAFRETFYCSRSFAIGSVAMTMVDNPGQQTVWSMVCPAEKRALVFGGGQPRYRNPEGHSPYDQVIQKRGTLILLTGPTATAARPSAEERSRAENAAAALVPLPAPLPKNAKSLAAFWEAAPRSAASWLFTPRGAGRIIERAKGVFIEAGGAFIAVRPVGGVGKRSYFWVDPDPAEVPQEMAALRKYRVLVIPAGQSGVSGYVLDTDEASRYRTLEAFADAAAACPLSVSPGNDTTVAYTSLLGDALTMRYRPTGLCAEGTINRTPIDWANWASGGVYESPYLTIKDGVMTVSDGTESYAVRCDGETPVWRQSPGK